MLSPDLLRHLEQFQLLTQRASKSGAKGERRSRARGHSVEFADYRNYSPGDDFRYLDWNLYGRLEKFFLKLFEEERELPVSLFLDASESMGFGTPLKFTLAQQLTAAIAYVALCGFDQVSTYVFPEINCSPGQKHFFRSMRGRNAALPFLTMLQEIRPKGSFQFGAELRRASFGKRKAGLAVVISDFLSPDGYEQGLRSLQGRGFQVCAIQILSVQEIRPELFGELKLIDAETGAEQEVTFARYRLAAYQKTVEQFCQKLQQFCRARGMQFLSLRSDAPLEEALLKQLRKAQIWE